VRHTCGTFFSKMRKISSKFALTATIRIGYMSYHLMGQLWDTQEIRGTDWGQAWDKQDTGGQTS